MNARDTLDRRLTEAWATFDAARAARPMSSHDEEWHQVEHEVRDAWDAYGRERDAEMVRS